jgi:hypothetical protein
MLFKILKVECIAYHQINEVTRNWKHFFFYFQLPDSDTMVPSTFALLLRVSNLSESQTIFFQPPMKNAFKKLPLNFN